MNVLTDKIDGQYWHRVIPEFDKEREIAEKHLTPDNTGAFLDMGDEDVWNGFQEEMNLEYSKLEADYHDSLVETNIN